MLSIYLQSGGGVGSRALWLWAYILFFSNSFQGKWRKRSDRRTAESWTGVFWEEDQAARGAEWTYHQGKGRYPLKICAMAHWNKKWNNCSIILYGIE